MNVDLMEIERLKACLEQANTNHEKFERLYFLTIDERDAKAEAVSSLESLVEEKRGELVRLRETLDEHKHLVHRLMADMVIWGGEEDGVPDFAVGFWAALSSLGGWVESEGEDTKIFLPGPVVDHLQRSRSWTKEATAPDVAKAIMEAHDLVAKAKAIMKAGQVPLEQARDSGVQVEIPRALVRRLMVSLNFLVGFHAAACDANPTSPTESVMTDYSRYHDRKAREHLARLQEIAMVGDDEDLDD